MYSSIKYENMYGCLENTYEITTLKTTNNAMR